MKKMKTMKTIREHIRAVLAARGHSIARAEDAMGMSRCTLRNFLKENSFELSRRNCQRLADYLGLEYNFTRNWITRDARRLRKKRRQQQQQQQHVATSTTSCWGELAPRVAGKPGCADCCYIDECRAHVCRGRPLLCGALLPRERGFSTCSICGASIPAGDICWRCSRRPA